MTELTKLERQLLDDMTHDCYYDNGVDSAIRHYCKHIAGHTDERHDVAFLWNIISAIWTCEHKPEYNSYAKGEE